MMMKMKIMEIILLQQQPTGDAVILLLHLFIHLLLLPHIKLKSCKNNILFLSAFISI